MVTALTGIGTAVVLYPVAKRYRSNGALSFLSTRILEASMIFVGVLTVLAMVTLHQDVSADAPGLAVAGDSLIALKDWTFLPGPGFMASMNALALGTVMYRSRLVPRVIPTLGLVGAPLLFLSSTGTLFGLWEQTSGPAGVLVAPIFVWELSLGIYMTVKGFRPDAAQPYEEAEAAAASAGLATTPA